RSPGNAFRRHSWIVLGAAWLVAVLLGMMLWKRWQDEQRNIMAMASLDWFDAVLMGVLSPVAGAMLVVAGRMIVNAVAGGSRFIQRRVPTVVPVPITLALIVLLSIVIGRGVAFRALTAAAYSFYAPANEQTTEGILAPDSSSVSGSRTSFVAWDTLGYMG